MQDKRDVKMVYGKIHIDSWMMRTESLDMIIDVIHILMLDTSPILLKVFSFWLIIILWYPYHRVHT